MALKGRELLEYLNDHEGEDRNAVMEGAGYVCRRNGKQSIQRTKFFEALAEANGHELGPITYHRPEGFGKEATYRLRVGPKGLIPVSRAYTHQCQMTPGSYVKVIIEDGVIVLEPEEEVQAQPPTARLQGYAA